MMRPSRLLSAVLLLASLLLAGGERVRALNIVISTDLGYFASNPTAQATILKAAADVSSAITGSLSAIDQDVFQTTVNGMSATIDWRYRYFDPITGAEVVIDPAFIPANTVSVRVLGNRLPGQTLGNGSTVLTGLQINASGNITQPNLTAAVNTLNTLTENEFRRGAGAYNRFDQTLQMTVGGNLVNARVDVDFGIAYGVIQLDDDSDNNGVVDNASALNNYWHLDYQTPVAAGKRDLYSVMIHELLHVLGVGSSTSWENLYTGSTWLGSEVIDEFGTGAGLIAPGGSHIAEGKMSRSIVNGAVQEAALDPTLNLGTRKYLTTLDLAFLRDLGYSTIEPEFGLQGDYNGDGKVDARDFTVWRNSLGSTSKLAADGNGNNVIDAGDYTVWKSKFGSSANAALDASVLASAPVPEPSALVGVLLLSGLAAMSRFSRPK